jgi:hypothetical protein
MVGILGDVGQRSGMLLQLERLVKSTLIVKKGVLNDRYIV